MLRHELRVGSYIVERGALDAYQSDPLRRAPQVYQVACIRGDLIHTAGIPGRVFARDRMYVLHAMCARCAHILQRGFVVSAPIGAERRPCECCDADKGRLYLVPEVRRDAPDRGDRRELYRAAGALCAERGWWMRDDRDQQ